MSERSKKLLRQYKRYLGNQNAEQEIVDFAQSLITEESSTKNHIATSLAGFPDFATAIDKVYVEYENRLDMAARNIEMSSKELTEALQEVEKLNASINAMLDSLGQGLLFFDRDGLCSEVCSHAAKDLLGCDPSNEYLTNIAPFSFHQDTFRRWLALVFDGNHALSFDDLKSMLPQEFIDKHNRFIELDYRPMYLHGSKLVGVLLIATDVTYKREAEENLNALERTNKKIMAIASDRNGFTHFLDDLGTLLSDIRDDMPAKAVKDNKSEIIRNLHTFKGQAGLYYLFDIMQFLHECETLCQAVHTEEDSAALKEKLLDYFSIIENEKSFTRNIFGNNFLNKGETRLVLIDTLFTLRNLAQDNIADHDKNQNLLEFINQELLSVPLFSAFEPFEREINRLSEQQNKPHPDVIFSGDNPAILKEDYKDFFNNLVHMARNIIDHGIESPEIRSKRGKEDRGKITIYAGLHNNDNEMKLKISISDDGNGINTNKIRRKLSLAPDIDENEVLHKIFEPAFSLSDQVGLISGRGIGLNAVKVALENIGGTITVISDYDNHTGTEFQITLPYSI